jgi:hypothetical protein
MRVLNPTAGTVQEVVSLPLEDRLTMDVIIVGDTLLHVNPRNGFEVIMEEDGAAAHIDYYRALGHRVSILNNKVSAVRVSGAWHVDERMPSEMAAHGCTPNEGATEGARWS